MNVTNQNQSLVKVSYAIILLGWRYAFINLPHMLECLYRHIITHCSLSYFLPSVSIVWICDTLPVFPFLAVASFELYFLPVVSIVSICDTLPVFPFLVEASFELVSPHLSLLSSQIMYLVLSPPHQKGLLLYTDNLTIQRISNRIGVRNHTILPENLPNWKWKVVRKYIANLLADLLNWQFGTTRSLGMRYCLQFIRPEGPVSQRRKIDLTIDLKGNKIP